MSDDKPTRDADLYITKDGETVPIGGIEEVNFNFEVPDRNLVGYTSNEALRELIEEWREKAEQKYDVGGLLCADELEELIE
jgi:hypothetical protein